MSKIILVLFLINLFNINLLAGPFRRGGTISKKFTTWTVSKRDAKGVMKFKTFRKKNINNKDSKISKESQTKTTLKNVNISTKVKSGNIDSKGSLNVGHVKIAKGSTLKDTNINSNVKTKNISVSKGASADIGSVNIIK